jgi:hypothetical protein
MQRLADFKRALTIGSKWVAKHYGRSGIATELGVRTVKIKQQNEVCFETIEGKTSWLGFPKAGDYENNNGIAEIYWPECLGSPRRLLITYQKIES